MGVRDITALKEGSEGNGARIFFPPSERDKIQQAGSLLRSAWLHHTNRGGNGIVLSSSRKPEAMANAVKMCNAASQKPIDPMTFSYGGQGQGQEQDSPLFCVRPHNAICVDTGRVGIDFDFYQL